MIYNFFVFPLWVGQWKAILETHVQKDLSQRAVKCFHDFLINRKSDSSKAWAEEWITVQEGDLSTGVLHIVN